MATSDRIELLGIFEDRPQSDFVGTLIETVAPIYGFEVAIERRLTAGCRIDNLNEHLGIAAGFSGVVIAVDGAKISRAKKIAKLLGQCSPPGPTLWSVADPSVEEWMMADAEALPAALRDKFGPGKINAAARPNRSHAEQTAKQRVREWVTALLGAPPLQGGVEYASAVARKVVLARVGSARNEDLKQLTETLLPDFLARLGSP